MKTVVQYSCFQDQHLIAPNLHHIYPFADRIVVAYGAFRGVRRIRSLWGLPEEDATLEILKSFPDPEDKLTVLEAPGGEWEDFTHSRRQALAACGDSGFLMTQDTDEFWAQGALERIQEVARHELKNGVMAIDCTRTWFVQGSELCLWPKAGLPRVVPSAHLPRGKALVEGLLGPVPSFTRRRLLPVLARLRLSGIGDWISDSFSPWKTFDYSNGVAYLPAPPKYIYKVVGFLLKPGLFWVPNKIDSRLMDPATGRPWHSHDRAIFDPDILCFHVSYCDPAIARVKKTYYTMVFEEISPEEAYQKVRRKEDAAANGSKAIERDGYEIQPLPVRFRNIRPRQLLEVTSGGN